MRLLLFLLLTVEAGGPPAGSPGSNVLTLEQAITNADDHQPLILQAIANTQAARARIDEVRGGLLPQLNGNGQLIYTYPFSESAGNAGGIVSGGVGSGGGGTVISGGGGHTTLGLAASQLITDFGQTWNKFRSYQQFAVQYKSTEDETRIAAHLTVRSAYYNARAQKALLEIARETLENEKKHLAQTEGMVQFGSKPEIALATEKATYASDKYQVTQAVGTYDIGKAQLNQAMGIEGPIDYDVLSIDAPVVPGEGETTEQLMAQAVKARPAYAAAVQQVQAQELLVASYRDNYWPNLFLQGGVNASATRPSNFAGNLYGELAMTWPIFNGLTNYANTREQEADLLLYKGQLDQVRQQIRVDLETARLQVATALSGLQSAQEGVINAHEQLRLAEGRYETGVGSVIELGDAQVAYVNAQVQQIQAGYNLNNARATLLAKLGAG